MRLRFGLNPAEPPAAATTQAGKFSADQRGTTAIEFAMVIGPFLFLLFGIISVGLYFFVIFTLEHAVESAARVIRTGQAQTQTPNVMTPGEFKARVCAKLPPFMDCTSVTNKIRVNVQEFADFAAINADTVPSCLQKNGPDAGKLIAAGTYSTGTQSTVVFVSVCYEWDFATSMANIPYWISPKSAKMANGSTLIQASTTFTSEPY